MALIQKAFSDIITFSRSSNATRIGPTGRVEYAPHNLLLQSQTFDNASWGKGNVTVTANSTAAADGTITADTFVESTDAGVTSHFIYQSPTFSAGHRYTMSVYLKAAASNRLVQLYVRDSTAAVFAASVFNLNTGVIYATTNGTSTITAVGNGWYRCTVTGTAVNAGAGDTFIWSKDSSGLDYTGNGSSVAYLWGAQLSVGPYPLDYTPTTSAAVYGPRFDYDPVTLAARGLLIEEQRTNNLSYSEQFNDAWWTKDATTISANAIQAPDGTTTADKLITDTTSAEHSVLSSNISITGGTAYTVSIFAKKGEKSFLFVNFNTPGFTAPTPSFFNLDTGVATAGANVTASMTPVGNGWYRCTATKTATSTISSSTHRIGLCDSTSSTTTTGANTTDGLYIWGAQLEAGAFATSYIPTVAASVTRSADVASVNTLSPWYNATEGTLFGEYDTFGVSSSPYIAEFNDGTANNRITSYVSSGTQRMYVATSGAAQADLSVSSVSNNVVYKTAVVYKANDFALTQNGVSPATDTSGTIPTVSKLALGAYNSDSIANLTNGHLRRIAYYPRRLTNAELQALTA